jgi:hypothetical protein
MLVRKIAEKLTTHADLSKGVVKRAKAGFREVCWPPEGVLYWRATLPNGDDLASGGAAKRHKQRQPPNQAIPNLG